MNTAYTFRKAKPADADRIWEILLQAKAMMKREGRMQWDEDYPTRELVDEDITKGIGYVLCSISGNTAVVIAYGAVVFDGEPVYNTIDGKWLSDGQYVVLHRLAVADEAKGRGISGKYLMEVENLALKKGVYSFKCDTRSDNTYMLKSFEKFGFIPCGTVYYGKGSRLAFEKSLKKDC